MLTPEKRKKYKITRVTIEPVEPGMYGVYAHGTYPDGVLKGYAYRAYEDGGNNLEDLKEEYPGAEVLEHSTKQWYPDGNPLPKIPPSDFDPMDAGEVWGEDEY